MKNKQELFKLSENFKEEERILLKKGIDSWNAMNKITSEDIAILVSESRATVRNLNKIKGFAHLICEMKLSQSEAALLIHSGVPTIESIAAISPQELLQKTGRFERQLQTGRLPIVNLNKASSWIKRAIEIRQIRN
tara:strand:+ start:25 stop:432 length:408 start_codon:yes stop_codon:yes gene_type:complete